MNAAQARALLEAHEAANRGRVLGDVLRDYLPADVVEMLATSLGPERVRDRLLEWRDADTDEEMNAGLAWIDGLIHGLALAIGSA